MCGWRDGRVSGGIIGLRCGWMVMVKVWMVVCTKQPSTTCTCK